MDRGSWTEGATFAATWRKRGARKYVLVAGLGFLDTRSEMVRARSIGATPWLCTVTHCGRINGAGDERCANALCRVKRDVWGVEWAQDAPCTVGAEEESCVAALCLLKHGDLPDALEQAVDDLMQEAVVAPEAAAAVWDAVLWEALDAQVRTAGLGAAVDTLMQEVVDTMNGEGA